MIQPSGGGHALTVVNSAAVKVGVHVSLNCRFQGVGLLEHKVTLVLVFFEEPPD